MSDLTTSRIAVLQHKRRQAAAREALSKTSDQVGEPRHESIDPATSLRLQSDLYTRVKEMRNQGKLCKNDFADAESAVSAAEEHLERLGRDAVFEVYAGASGSGFFAGPVSVAFLSACLRGSHESIALVLPDLGAGLLLDVVLDDPRRGNFYEVEWW